MLEAEGQEKTKKSQKKRKKDPDLSMIFKRKTGLALIDTIAHKNRLFIHIGKATQEQCKNFQKNYLVAKAGLTESERQRMTAKRIKEIIDTIKELPEDARRESLVTQIAPRTLENPLATTWNELIDECIDRVDSTLSESQQASHVRYMEMVRIFLSENNIELYTETPDNAFHLYNSWRSDYRRDTDKRTRNIVSRSTIQKELDTWKKICQFAERKRHLPVLDIWWTDNGTELKIPVTKENTETVFPLTTDEVEAVFKSLRDCGNWRLHDLALLAYLTSSELKALSWIQHNHPKCIDKKAETIKIFYQQIHGRGDGKTDVRARELPLTAALKAIFERGFVLEKFDVDSFVGNMLRKSRGYTFPEECEKWGFHQLRHSFITHHLAAGYDSVAVSRWAGHYDSSTTERIYGKFARIGIPSVKKTHKGFLSKFKDYFDVYKASTCDK